MVRQAPGCQNSIFAVLQKSTDYVTNQKKLRPEKSNKYIMMKNHESGH